LALGAAAWPFAARAAVVNSKDWLFDADRRRLGIAASMCSAGVFADHTASTAVATVFACPATLSVTQSPPAMSSPGSTPTPDAP
jgi:hypothetical protein